jgi:uncharacterized protein (UPF0332 family)
VTPDTARRLAKAERFLTQSNGQSPDEAPEATIHLAYYAMLHAAAAVLMERTGRVPKSHGAIIGQFSHAVAQQDEAGRALSRAFNRAEDERLAADYDDAVVPTARSASEMRELAQAFVTYCRALL